MQNKIKKYLYLTPFIILMTYLIVENLISPSIALLIIFTVAITAFLIIRPFRRNQLETSIDIDKQPSVFVNIIEKLTDPFLLLDHNKNIIMANTPATRLFGDNIIDRKISDYFHDKNTLTAIKNAIENGQSKTIEYNTKSPRKRSFLLRIHVLDNIENNESHKTERTIFLAIYDITNIREAERMRVDFVANVSHELRTPLASILGFVETLQGPAKDDEDARERFLKIMNDEASRMSRLIEDLLSLSHIERDAHIAPEEYVSLNAIINSTIETLNIRLTKKSMITSFKSEPNIERISGDHDQLTQVFQNLIENAIKYGEDHSNIDVVMKRYVDPESNKRFVKITVTNKGAGIAPEHLERLTERFYRVDTARSRSLGGTGLGLAIVKHIIQRHEGKLSFQSKVGEYTTASILLPLYS